jgi:hypothetical protein
MLSFSHFISKTLRRVKQKFATGRNCYWWSFSVSLDKLVRKKVITAKAHFLGEVKGEVDVDIFTTIIKSHFSSNDLF